MSLADQSQQWFPTTAQVTVLQARGLRAKGKNGTNDAYAIMQVAKDKFSTAVAEKSVAPMWKEQASFDLPPAHHGTSERGTLRVHVMHRALVGPDKPLGQAVVNLLELHEVKSRNKTEWFKLLDKAGKADKERGEVLLDIQFTKNNMTASMFDLSGADGSRSRIGKFKDKLRGKKKGDAGGASDSASAVVPASFSQVLTDSEEEEGGGEEGDGTKGEKGGKKKLKLKSLFSHKSNLRKGSSQSLSFLGGLPERNQALSGSRSSGLNVEPPSEGKKKFKFGIHKRSGSTDSKTSQASGPVPAAEAPGRGGSRAGSTFSLSSSGRGSMEDLHRGPSGSMEGSFSSYDSLRVPRPQASPWMGSKATEEEVEEEEVEEEEEDDVREYERRRRDEEEERARQEEQMRIDRRREEEQEQRKRQDAERTRREERERWEAEEQRQKVQRDEENRIRMEREEEEEETFRREEERARMEEERKEAEWKREVEEERERMRVMEEERKKQEEEEVRMREEMERTAKERAEKERWEEQARMEREEEERKKREWEEQQEQIRMEKEQERRAEEDERVRVRREEEREEEEERRVREERRLREEEEEKRVCEERRLREVEEEREEEEKRVREQRRLREEEEREEEEKRVREERRLREEEEEREEEAKRVREERRLREEEEREEEEKGVREERRLREEEREEEERRLRAEEEEREEERRVREEEEERMSQMKERAERRLRESELEEERVRKEREEERREKEETARIEKERKRQEEERIRMEAEERRREEEEEEEAIKRQEQLRLVEEERHRAMEQQRSQNERGESEEELEEEFATIGQMRSTLFDIPPTPDSYFGPGAAPNEDSPCAPAGGVASARRRGPAPPTPPSGGDAPHAPARPFVDQTVSVPTARPSPASRRSPPPLFEPSNPFFEASESEPDPDDHLSGKKRRAPPPPSRRDPPPDKPPRDRAAGEQSAAVSAARSAAAPGGAAETSLRLDGERDGRRAALVAPRPPDRHGARIASEEPMAPTTQAQTTRDAPRPSERAKGPAPSKPNPGRTDVSARLRGGGPEHARRTAPSFEDARKNKDQRPSTNPFDEDEDEEEEEGGMHPADPDGSTPGASGPPPTPPAATVTPKCLSAAEAQTPDGADGSSSSKGRSLKTARAPLPPEGKGQSAPAKASRAVRPDPRDSVPSSTATEEEEPGEEQAVAALACSSKGGRVETNARTTSVGSEMGAGPAPPSRRAHPVKPLTPSEQQSPVSARTANPPSEVLRPGGDGVEVKDDEAAGPFAQLTRGELLLLLQKLQGQLAQRDCKISELEQYIDNLLVRIMEEEPSILMSLSAMKH